MNESTPEKKTESMDSPLLAASANASSDSVSRSSKHSSQARRRGFNLQAFSEHWPFLHHLNDVAEKVPEDTPTDTSSSFESPADASSHHHTKSRRGAEVVQGPKARPNDPAAFAALDLADFAHAELRAVVQSNNLSEQIILASDNADLSSPVGEGFGTQDLPQVDFDATHLGTTSEPNASDTVLSNAAGNEAASPGAGDAQAATSASTAPTGRTREPIVYRASELFHLLDLEPEDLRALHRIKRTFGVRLAKSSSKKSAKTSPKKSPNRPLEVRTGKRATSSGTGLGGTMSKQGAAGPALPDGARPLPQHATEAQEIPLAWLLARGEAAHVHKAVEHSS